MSGSDKPLTCGDFGGETAKGQACTRRAGWGTDASEGLCKYHRPDPGGARGANGWEDIPEPPAHLSRECQQRWIEIHEGWKIGPEARELLRGALEQWDQYQQAREVLRREGPTVTNEDSGHVSKHPAAQVAKEAFSAFRLAMKDLGLQPFEE